MILQRSLASLRRHPSGLLLGVQLLAIILYPFLERAEGGRAAFVIAGNLVLALTLWVVFRSPLVNWIGWVLAGPAVGISLLGHLGGFPDILFAAHLLEAALYFYAAVGLIVYMLKDTHVTFDELLAAGATFTLLAWAFAFTFSVCQYFLPGSFVTSLSPLPQRTPMELLFLSFSVLSAVGLSDVLPATGAARSLVMLEMFCGVMYIAIVVSRLIALTVLHLKIDDRNSPP